MKMLTTAVVLAVGLAFASASFAVEPTLYTNADLAKYEKKHDKGKKHDKKKHEKKHKKVNKK